jgi:hypothetical protein
MTFIYSSGDEDVCMEQYHVLKIGQDDETSNGRDELSSHQTADRYGKCMSFFFFLFVNW